MATILTGLLHDTVEDTPTSLGAIRREFGSEVAQLVGWVTKLTRLKLRSRLNVRSENYKKLILAMSEDVRVLIVNWRIGYTTFERLNT